MVAPPRTRIDVRPAELDVKVYAGDPFDFTINVTVDGVPADVDGWIWAALIEVGGDDMIAFETTGLADGVTLYLRGSASAAIPPGRFCRFDVVGRDPTAGEGRTVAAGTITTSARVTPPVRALAAAR